MPGDPRNSWNAGNTHNILNSSSPRRLCTLSEISASPNRFSKPYKPTPTPTPLSEQLRRTTLPNSLFQVALQSHFFSASNCPHCVTKNRNLQFLGTLCTTHAICVCMVSKSLSLGFSSLIRNIFEKLQNSPQLFHVYHLVESLESTQTLGTDVNRSGWHGCIFCFSSASSSLLLLHLFPPPSTFLPHTVGVRITLPLPVCTLLHKVKWSFSSFLFTVSPQTLRSGWPWTEGHHFLWKTILVRTCTRPVVFVPSILIGCPSMVFSERRIISRWCVLSLFPTGSLVSGLFFPAGLFACFWCGNICAGMLIAQTCQSCLHSR